MKLQRGASLLVAILAASAACKSSNPPAAAPTSSPVVAEPKPAPTAAAPADPWAKHEAAKNPLPHPLFWAIEKDGKTTYLLGTMHMGIDPEARIPEMVWKKLDDANTFAMETDLTQAGKLDVALPAGTTLHQQLGDAYWKKLEDAVGADMAKRLDHMKPMIPATELSTRGLPETAPMDGVLFGRATNEHKQIVYLEPIEKQVTMLEKWMDARALKDLLDDLPLQEKHSKEMLDAYAAGDETKILALSDEERADFKKHGRTDAEYDAQMEDLLYSRNASWIDEIEKIHAGGGGFIAVGAMHLIGPRSVLDLLQKKGYKVTRLEGTVPPR